MKHPNDEGIRVDYAAEIYAAMLNDIEQPETAGGVDGPESAGETEPVDDTEPPTNDRAST